MIESSNPKQLLSAEQLRQKAIRQADLRGRKLAFRRMLWRYFTWISWSWILPSIGSLTLVLVMVLMLWQGPKVAYASFLNWIGFAKPTVISYETKKPNPIPADSKEIKILSTDTSLSDFSIQLLKQEQLEEESSQAQEAKLNQNQNDNNIIPASLRPETPKNLNQQSFKSNESNKVNKVDVPRQKLDNSHNGAKSSTPVKNKEIKNNKNVKDASTVKDKNK